MQEGRQGNVERPEVYRFSGEGISAETVYFRTSTSLSLVISDLRIKHCLQSQDEIENARTLRDEIAYDLSNGAINRSAYAASPSPSSFTVQISSNNIHLGRRQLGLIGPSGARTHFGQISLEILEGARAESCIRYYPATPPSDADHVYVSLWLSPDELETVAKRLQEQPDCTVSIKIHLMGYERRGYSFGEKDLYIEADRAVRLTGFAVEVANSEKTGPIEIERAKTDWLDAYRAGLTQDDVYMAPVVELGINAIADRLAKAGDKPRKYLFEASEQFVSQLDSDLRIYTNSPFKSDKTFWSHINFRNFLDKTTVAQRQEFYEPSDAIATYISNPQIRNDYFDWLILDIIVAQKITALFESFMHHKHGSFTYSLVGNVWWKLLLVKMATKPLALAIGWLLPAIGFYFVAQSNLWLGIALALLYYGINFLMLIRGLWTKAVSWLPGMPNIRRRILRQLEQVERIYSFLAGPVIHIESVRNAFNKSIDEGVFWDQSVFYILDDLTRRNPQPWRNSMHVDIDLRKALERIAKEKTNESKSMIDSQIQ